MALRWLIFRAPGRLVHSGCRRILGISYDWPITGVLIDTCLRFVSPERPGALPAATSTALRSLTQGSSLSRRQQMPRSPVPVIPWAKIAGRQEHARRLIASNHVHGGDLMSRLRTAAHQPPALATTAAPTPRKRTPFSYG